MVIIKNILVICIIGIASFGLLGQTLEFKMKGSWNYIVSASEIIEAGTDFSGNYESNRRQIDIDLRLKPAFWNRVIEYTWQIDISKSDIDWHPDIEIYARVTDRGRGYGINPYMIGGENYMKINDIDQLFFNGSAARRNIKIQYELRNISVTLPAKSYSTTIVYTITSTF